MNGRSKPLVGLVCLVQPVSNLQSAISNPQPLPRLGQLSFINTLPVTIPFEKNHMQLPAIITTGTPMELNQGYAKGQLDLGAMSSFFYLQQQDLVLLPDVSISCDGPVGSVLFFSKVSPDKLHNARIAVPSSSATSVNLLRVLLKEHFNISVTCITSCQPALDDPATSGALVIGDRAMEVDANWSNLAWRADLGQWWSNQYGLPMVFGLWAAREQWVNANQEQFTQVSSMLGQAALRGLSDLFGAVMTEAAKRTGFETHVLQRYYKQQLNFEFTTRHHQGLNLFRALCLKHGFLQSI
jgi:chorismate dehydratase